MNTTPPFPPELWEQTPVAVQADIRTLAARVAALEATVQRLRERRQQDARHASRPPSRAAPNTPRPRSRRVPQGRQPGGQPGHAGQTQALVPVTMEDLGGLPRRLGTLTHLEQATVQAVAAPIAEAQT